MFCGFNEAVMSFIDETTLALDGKDDVGYHNRCNEQQPVDVEPFHNCFAIIAKTPIS